MTKKKPTPKKRPAFKKTVQLYLSPDAGMKENDRFYLPDYTYPDGTRVATYKLEKVQIFKLTKELI
jgi:hypothetical protein